MEHINRVVTWRTKKVDNGFEFRVFSLDYKKDTIIHKTGVLPTRARAVTQAKKWVRHYKSAQVADKRSSLDQLI
jgi:hypothetical protein